jgi:hypothetical protein
MLVAAVVVGCRAVPVQTAAFAIPHIQRLQNRRETIFLPLLVFPVEIWRTWTWYSVTGAFAA